MGKEYLRLQLFGYELVVSEHLAIVTGNGMNWIESQQLNQGMAHLPAGLLGHHQRRHNCLLLWAMTGY